LATIGGNMICLIDCRVDNVLSNNYLELNLWGKPCFAYVIDSVISARVFSDIIIITESKRIINYCQNMYPKICIFSTIQRNLLQEDYFCISGRAPLISAKTIKKAFRKFSNKTIISSRSEAIVDFNREDISNYTGVEERTFNAFIISKGGMKQHSDVMLYNVPSIEAVVINSNNDFELALVLKRKQNNRLILDNAIKNEINKKNKTFSEISKQKSVCLIGHSQIAQWKLQSIFGYEVRNCGISGISSFEYNKYLLETKKLKCDDDICIVMHGTNDIVLDYTLDKIVTSIENTIEYIRNESPKSVIFFLSCMHVNGRLDRNNAKIDELNRQLKKHLKNVVKWIDTCFMDNQFGLLDEKYTLDGLHLNELGYDVLRERLEFEMRKMNL